MDAGVDDGGDACDALYGALSVVVARTRICVSVQCEVVVLIVQRTDACISAESLAGTRVMYFRYHTRIFRATFHKARDIIEALHIAYGRKTIYRRTH